MFIVSCSHFTKVCQPPESGTQRWAFFYKEHSINLKFETIGSENSTWRVVIDGHCILLGARIDDFVIAWANRQIWDTFHARLLKAFKAQLKSTYEGPLNATSNVKMPVTWLPTQPLYFKSNTLNRYCKHVNLGNSTAQHTDESENSS